MWVQEADPTRGSMSSSAAAACRRSPGLDRQSSRDVPESSRAVAGRTCSGRGRPGDAGAVDRSRRKAGESDGPNHATAEPWEGLGARRGESHYPGNPDSDDGEPCADGDDNCRDYGTIAVDGGLRITDRLWPSMSDGVAFERAARLDSRRSSASPRRPSGTTALRRDPRRSGHTLGSYRRPGIMTAMGGYLTGRASVV